MDTFLQHDLLPILLRIEQARHPLVDRGTLPGLLDQIAQEMLAVPQIAGVAIQVRADLFDPPLPVTVQCGTLALDPVTYDLAWAGVALGQVRLAVTAERSDPPAVLPLLLRVISESIAEVRAVELLVQQTQERIRRALADELHASVQQTLAGIRLIAERMTRDVVRDPPAAAQFAEDIREAAQQAFTEQRFVIHDLRGLDVRHTVAADLQRLLTQVARQMPDLVLTQVVDLPIIPAALAACLVHILRNVLMNSALYAQARTVHVAIHSENQGVAVHIADDGVGCDLQAALAAPGIGLKSVIERITMLGGRYQFTGAPGAGMRLDVWLPLPVC